MTLVHGDGTAVFFAATAACASSPACSYVSPPSEFSTLTRTADRFALVSPAGDSTVFTPGGAITRTVDRFGLPTHYYYYTYTCNWCRMGSLGSVIDHAGKYRSIGYSPTGFEMYVDNAAYAVGVVNADSDLVAVHTQWINTWTATYSAHRLTGYADRLGNQTSLTYDGWGKLASVISPAYRA